METKNKNTKEFWRDLMNPWTLSASFVVLAGVAFGIWLIANMWSLLIVAILAVGAIYIYRKVKSGIKVADGVTITSSALTSYLLQIIREQEGNIHPDLLVKGTGDNMIIKLRMDFPEEPERAADFHSRIIYLQGYIARKLYDDFRISGAKVEIEAAQRVRTRETILRK
jgi:uncharacterized membrane protein